MIPNPVKVGFGPFAVFSQPISKKETFGQPYTHKIHTNISEKTGEAQRKKEASAEKKKVFFHNIQQFNWGKKILFLISSAKFISMAKFFSYPNDLWEVLKILNAMKKNQQFIFQKKNLTVLICTVLLNNEPK